MEPRNDWRGWSARELEKFPGYIKQRVALRATEAPNISAASAPKSEDVETYSVEWTSEDSCVTGPSHEEEARRADDFTLTFGDGQWLPHRSQRGEPVPSFRSDGIHKQENQNSVSEPTHEENGRCVPQYAPHGEAHGSRYHAGARASRSLLDHAPRPRRQPSDEPDHSIRAGGTHKKLIKEEEKQIGCLPGDVGPGPAPHESYSNISGTEEQPATKRVEDKLRFQETDGPAGTLGGAREGTKANKYLCKNLNANHVNIVNVYCDSIPESLLQRWLK